MSVIMMILAILLYALNVFLVTHYVKKRTGINLDDPRFDLTAGTGITPKWISHIFFYSVAAFIMSLVPLILEAIELIF